MPTVFVFFGFCFKFYSDDHEPVHLHIFKEDHEAKFNVQPEIIMVYNHGFKNNELAIIRSVLEENKEVIIERWNEFFSK